MPQSPRPSSGSKSLKSWLTAFSTEFRDENKRPKIFFSNAAKKKQSISARSNQLTASVSHDEPEDFERIVVYPQEERDDSEAPAPEMQTQTHPILSAPPVRQSLQWILILQAHFRTFVSEKEELTKANVTSTERRGRTRGFITSVWPPFGLGGFLKNYAEKKGLFYKGFHPGEEYKSGQSVFFPALQKFYGAKIKGLRTKKTDETLVEMRMRNMGFAEAIYREADYSNYGTDLEEDCNAGVRVCKEIMDQLAIKSNLQEYDEYFDLLKNTLEEIEKNNPIEYEEAKMLCTMDPTYLFKKFEYLDTLSCNAVFDDFGRGLDYSFDAYQRSGIENPIDFVEAKKPQRVIAVNCIRPSGKPFDMTDRAIISVPIISKFGDDRMHMEVESEKYADFKIIGRTDDYKLIGKDNEVLEEGWYQFVIMTHSENGDPEIRYFACGDRKKDKPFSAQDVPSQTSAAIHCEGEKTYQIQYPPGHALRYNKYISHSQLAGGESVISGGAFMIKEGHLCMIEDSSGHYAVKENDPDRYKALVAAKDAFDHFGIDTSRTVLERWEPYAGVDKVFMKVAACLSQPFFETTLTERAGVSDRVAELRSTAPAHTGTPIRPRTTIQLLCDEQRREEVVDILGRTINPRLGDLRNADLSELDLSHANIQGAIINARTQLKGATLSSEQVNLLYDKGVRNFENIKVVNGRESDGNIILIRPDVYQHATFSNITIPIEHIQMVAGEKCPLPDSTIKAIDISKSKEDVEMLTSLFADIPIKISAEQAVELHKRNLSILEEYQLDREEFKKLLKLINAARLPAESALLKMIQRECKHHNISPGFSSTLCEKNIKEGIPLRFEHEEPQLEVMVLLR